MSRSPLTWIVPLALAVLPARVASAQYFGGYGGGGSTVQGDILRGEGFFLAGLGQFNLASAMATSINVDTAIRWNEYLYSSIKEDNRQKALHRIARMENTKRQYEAILTRVRENPNTADVLSGAALNAILRQLLDPKISPSAFRGTKIALAGDTVEKIPFSLGSEGVTFSVHRLFDKNGWPIALRGPEFARERRNYQQALDRALEQNLEGTLAVETIEKVLQAIEELEVRVHRAVAPTEKVLYVQAREYLNLLRASARMLASPSVEQAIAAIEVYPGTTVDDLRLFMQKHNLRFGGAKTLEERELYQQVVYPALILQRDGVVEPDIK